jgi:4-diphosphocytidyl-2-C-methyl-D-erythritol kinase
MLSQRPSAPALGGSDLVPFVGFPAGPDAVVVAAPAKVNLHLEVLGKRPDGYHAIETLILAVDLFDTLEVRRDPSGELILECDPPGLPTGPQNLVWKAADALRRLTGTTEGAAIRLTKRVPHEAGLGGGSSDAAATIVALNRVWKLGRTREELLPVAAEVGSDVGFFLSSTAAWCTGRGEVVEPEEVGGEIQLVLVKPEVGLSTAAVYRKVTVPAKPVDGTEIRKALRSGDPERLARALFNRLQEPATVAEPVVGRVLQTLSECDPLGWLMSGSGSCCFAVCRDRSDAYRVARDFAANWTGVGCRVLVVRGGCDPRRGPH